MTLFSALTRAVRDTLATIQTDPQAEALSERQSHSSAAASVQHPGGGPPRTRMDVARVRFLLSSPHSPLRLSSDQQDSAPAQGSSRLPALPPELVTIILDEAEYHPCRVNFHYSPVVFLDNANELYFRTPPLESLFERNCLKKIEFRIVSHDQGWSGEPRETQGTHENSWTWWEASLDRPPPASPTTGTISGSASPSLSADATPPLRGSRRGSVIAWEEVARYEVVRNLHAVADFTSQTVTFGPDHELVQQARRGDAIGLWARTRFPNWKNYAKEVEIKVWQSC